MIHAALSLVGMKIRNRVFVGRSVICGALQEMTISAARRGAKGILMFSDGVPRRRALEMVRAGRAPRERGKTKTRVALRMTAGALNCPDTTTTLTVTGKS